MISGAKKQTRKTLTEQQRLLWLQLIRCENVGPQTFHQLLARFGTVECALHALPDLAKKGGRRQIFMASFDDAKRELEQAQRQKIRFIAITEPDYPPLLRLVHAPPPLLSVKGETRTLTRHAIGIVGARNASAVGRRMAAQFAHALGEAGFVIISGFARGIDATAHAASLKTGTIAVMAGGLDKIYPSENERLYHEIVEHDGVIISEMPFGFEPRARDFPRRNRLIAGISLATLVVEAARRSGSLITARLAGENGRLVFAVPGSPLDPNAAGGNDLIKQGAILADNHEEVIEAILPMIASDIQEKLESRNFGFDEEEADILKPPVQDTLDDKDRQRLLNCLSLTPIDRETLALSADLPLPQLYLGLLELDLGGRLLHHNGGLVSLKCD